jgi:hypothetical protein
MTVVYKKMRLVTVAKKEFILLDVDCAYVDSIIILVVIIEKARF